MDSAGEAVDLQWQALCGGLQLPYQQGHLRMDARMVLQVAFDVSPESTQVGDPARIDGRHALGLEVGVVPLQLGLLAAQVIAIVDLARQPLRLAFAHMINLDLPGAWRLAWRQRQDQRIARMFLDFAAR